MLLTSILPLKKLQVKTFSQSMEKNLIEMVILHKMEGQLSMSILLMKKLKSFAFVSRDLVDKPNALTLKLMMSMRSQPLSVNKLKIL
jgi:hypothetical protein